jgi:GPN-loop GTPase
MLHLTHAIDRATGYVFVPPTSAGLPEGTVNDPSAPAAERANAYGLFASAAGQLRGPGSDVRDVQERWIDARDVWDAWEKKKWREEGEQVRKMAEEAAKLQVSENSTAGTLKPGDRVRLRGS